MGFDSECERRERQLRMFLPDRRAAVSDLARVVKPGGRLVTGQQGLPRHANAPRLLAFVADPGTVTVTGFWQIGARKT